MSTTPTKEPTRARAGDTWKWRREDLVADYPAPTWSLTYRFKNAAGGFEIVAAADGANFAITVAATTTTAIPAGDYDYTATVAAAGEKFTITTGRLTVEPDFQANDAANPLDNRSHARHMLDAIEAALEGRADATQLDIVAKAINGRNMQRDPMALIKLRDLYRLEARRERQAARVAAGLPSGRGIYTRFARA